MEKSCDVEQEEQMSVYSFHNLTKEDHWMSQRLERIRRLAKTEVLFAVLAILLSSFVLACKPCGTQQSAGSGVWCSIYFLLVGVMCLSKDGMLSTKIIFIFGGIGIHFALLMLAVEGIEAAAAFGDTPPNYLGATAHITLCIIAFTEFILLIGTMYLHAGKKRNSKKVQDSDKTNSMEDCILIRTLAEK